MRLLLDECVPKRLGREFRGHQVVTAVEAGWAGLSNGALLRAAAEEFDAFITVDQGVQFQQNLAGAAIRVVVIVAERNTLEALRPLVPKVLEALQTLTVGQLIRVAG